jgi:hypothetical protein
MNLSEICTVFRHFWTTFLKARSYQLWSSKQTTRVFDKANSSNTLAETFVEVFKGLGHEQMWGYLGMHYGWQSLFNRLLWLWMFSARFVIMNVWWLPTVVNWGPSCAGSSCTLAKFLSLLAMRSSLCLPALCLHVLEGTWQECCTTIKTFIDQFIIHIVVITFDTKLQCFYGNTYTMSLL